jgi:hypothetical protein
MTRLPEFLTETPAARRTRLNLTSSLIGNCVLGFSALRA